jgi:hypothetical protein
MNIDDLLAILTPEQLEHLAKLKRMEQNETQVQPEINNTPPVKSKRKQQRKKQKPSTQSQTGALENAINKKGSPAKRSGLQLGPRPNIFENSPEFHSDLQLIEDDKKLWGNNKPSVRDRKVSLVDATCTRCKVEYEGISTNACYKDGRQYIFTCDNCMKGSR